MDPNEALVRIVSIAHSIELLDTIPDSNVPEYAAELAAAVLDLDEWLRIGGFLPERWHAKVRS